MNRNIRVRPLACLLALGLAGSVWADYKTRNPPTDGIPVCRPGLCKVCDGGAGSGDGRSPVLEVSATVDSLHLQISLGSPRTGDDLCPGHLILKALSPSAALATPQALSLAAEAKVLQDQLIDSPTGLVTGKVRRVDFCDRNGDTFPFIFWTGEEGIPAEKKTSGTLRMTASEMGVYPVSYTVVYGNGYQDRFVRAGATNTFARLSSVVTPQGVSQTLGQSGIEFIRDSENVLRQAKIPAGLSDIQILSDYAYEIRFYPPGQIGAQGTNGVYAVTGSPQRTVRIENPDTTNAVNRLNVTWTEGATVRAWAYAYEANAHRWTLQQSDRREQIYDTDDDLALEYDQYREIIETNSNQVLSRIVEHKKRFDWDDETVQETAQPDDAHPQITLYEYYTNTVAGAYGKLKTVQYPDGSWVRYEYDSQGRKTRDITPWADTAVTADPSAARTVEYGYTPNTGGDTLLTNDHRPRQEVEKIQNIVVGKSYFAYETDQGESVETEEQAAGASAVYGATGNRRTVRRYYATSAGIAAGRVKQVAHPDGRLEDYTYETGTFQFSTNYASCAFTAGSGTDLRVSLTRRAAGAPGDQEGRTVRDITVTDATGRTRLQETWVFTGSAFDRGAWSVFEYDILGRKIAAHHSDTTQESWAWEGKNIVRETARSGIVTTNAYDTFGQRTSSAIEGVSEILGYAAQPTRTAETVYDTLGRAVIQARTAGSLRLAVTNAYDAHGRMIQSRDPSGRETEWSYSANGRTVTQTLPGGATVITEQRTDGRTTRVSGTGAIEQTYTYGVETDGRQWTCVYSGPAGIDSPAWQKSWTDLLGQTVRIERPGYNGETLVAVTTYDTAGRPVKIEQLNSSNQRIAPAQITEYDAFGEAVRQGLDIDGNGALAEGTSDRIGLSAFELVYRSGHWWKERASILLADESGTAEVTNAIVRTQLGGPGCACDGSETENVDLYGQVTRRVTYMQPDHRIEVTDVYLPGTTQIAQTVTRNGLVVLNTSAGGVTTVFSYDALGRQTEARTDSQSGARSVAAITHYNDRGEVDWVSDARTNTTGFAYDAAGRRSAVTNALGQVTATFYDVLGNATNVTGATYPVSYGYDAWNRMVWMKTYRAENGSGDTTQWQYDLATGLVTNKVYADTNATAYRYTADGKLSRRIWARGVTTDYAYDITGAMTNVVYSDSTPAVSFAYDHIGRPVEIITAGVCTNAYVYNASTLALTEETRSSRFGPSETITHTYDALGRMAGLGLENYAAGYAYDSYGRLSTVSSTNTSNAVTGQWTYDYVPGSYLISGWTTPQGHFWTRTYETGRDAIAGVQGGYNATPQDTYAYVNDALGRRTGRIDGGVTTNVFGYNVRSEVTSAMMGTNQFGYAYDPIGNRLSATNNAEAFSYAANVLNQYTNITDGVTVNPTYDSDGNMMTYGSQAFVWDGENRLIGVSSNGTASVTNAYDHLSRRIAKQTAAGTETFTYAGVAIIRHIAADGAKSDFIYGLDLSGSMQDAGTVGGILGAVRQGDTAPTCYFYDGNGNVTLLIDPSGTVTARYAYGPFGATLSAAGAGAAINPFRFSTKWFDEETGLYGYGFRFYSPELGRWLSRDSISEQGGLNVYAFVRNAPNDLVDILGLTDPKLGVALAIGLGWDNVTGPYISTVSLVGSAEQGLCDNLRFRGDVHVRLYSGGLGTTHGDHSSKDFGLDLTGALSATIGEGAGAGTSFYTLNYQTRSAIQNTFKNSFTWGQAWNYNSALGGTTRVGFMGLRADNFFMQYNNDVNRFPYGEGTDHGWTGGGILGLYVGGGNSIETGFQNFTGDILGFNLRHVGDGRSRDGYYIQDQGELSLNRAEWFLRYGGSQGSTTLSISSPDWLNVQHFIHDYITPSSARFEYPEFRYSLTVEGEIKAKY